MRATVRASILLSAPSTWGVYIAAEEQLPAQPKSIMDASGSSWPVKGLELATIGDGRSIGLRVERPARFERGEVVSVE